MLEIKDLHVQFHTSDHEAVRGIDLTVQDGEIMGLVGESGSGKTVTAMMVSGLLRPEQADFRGRILLDGIDIADLPRHTVRGEIGMVLQDTWLFHGTIRDNIRYGHLDATDEEVERAAQMACADHFIKTLPGGYDFELNEEASNVSHGQKQLLTIARAMLLDAPMLILDEATSNVDTRTEMQIQQAMRELMRDKTCFVVAHRLSTIRNADCILVVRDGNVVEQGTHEQLMAAGGFYRELYDAQFQ